MKNLILSVALLAIPPQCAAESDAAVQRREYVEKAHAQIEELGEKIEDLEDDVSKAGYQARQSMERKVEKLKSERRLAKRKLAKLKRASAQAWEDVRAAFDKALDDLRRDVDEAELSGGQ